jgi:alcohol sulfotransferase
MQTNFNEYDGLQYCGETHKVLFTHDIFNEGCSENTVTWQETIKIRKSPIAIEHGHKFYKHTPLVILTRDPRDAIVSYYYQKHTREPWLLAIGHMSPAHAGDYQDSLETFVKDEVYGIRRMIEFLNIWPEYIKDGAYHLTYEAMHKDATAEMVNVLACFGFDLDNELLRKSVENNTFNNSLTREKFNVNSLYEKEVIPENGLKCRKGKAGGWRDELTDEALDIVEESIHKHLNEYYGPFYDRF